MERVVDQLGVRLWPGRVRSVTPLTQGTTNSNYLVDLGDERVVVRVPGKDTGLLGIDRDVEVRAGTLAASIGVGPELIAFDADTGCLVTRYIDERAVTPEELATEPMLTTFVAALTRVHRVGRVPAVFDHGEVLRRYHRAATARAITAPFDVERAMATLELVIGARPFRPTVLGHNDLLNANFLFDGGLRFVDWEYAGMADPFFDLANVAVNNAFPEPAERRLLELYLGDVDDGARATFALMKFVSELREAMWGVMQMAISSLDVDFAAYALRRGAHALALVDGYDLGDLLDEAGRYARATT